MGSHVRAILSPVSTSAIRSFSLLTNKDVTTPADAALLRPSSLDSDTDEDKDGTKTSQLKRSFVIREDSDLHSVDLGSDFRNNLVLQHDSQQDDACYINLQHCRLYLDPDTSAIWVYNPSTSTFKIKEADMSVLELIYPTQSAALAPGQWDLHLGSGLDFAMTVFNSDAMSVAAPVSTSSIKPLNTTPDGRLLSTSKIAIRSPRHRTQNKDRKPVATETHIRIADHERAESRPEATVGITKYSRVVERYVDGILRAVKICRDLSGPQAAEMWKREVRMLKMIGNHPNVVELVGSNTSKREIVLSLIPGQSLASFINDQNMSTLGQEECEHIWQEIANGLLWVHSKEILHNDLKPANVVYNRDKGSAVLIDFGMAYEKILNPPPNAGTAWYVGPEILLRQRSYPSDVWSFGVTLLVAFGKIPYPDKTKSGWKLRSIYGDAEEALKMNTWIDRVRNVAEQLSERLQLLKSMLAYDPRDRISVRDLVSKLESRNRAKRSLIVGSN